MSNFQAIRNLYPEVVTIREEGEGIYTATDVNEEEVAINTADVATEAARLQAIADYQEPRQASYPSLGDQLDALFHAGVFPEDMAAQIQAVKDKYPKD